MYKSLIYVSLKSAAVVNPEQAMHEIIAIAQSRNARLDVTGALASTREHYVQILEGSIAAVGELMESIDNDPRHTNVIVLESVFVPQRSLPAWSMAYCGNSPYLARHVQTALSDLSNDSRLRIARLRSFLIGLANSGPPENGRGSR